MFRTPGFRSSGTAVPPHKNIHQWPPVKTWCNQNGFKEQSYYYYLKKIRKQEIEKIPVALPDPMEKPVLFKKLEVQTPIHTQAAVIIHLPAASLEIHNGATQQTLALNCLC